MSFLFQYPQVVLRLIGQHLVLTLSALSIALLIALPLGWALYRWPRWRAPVLGVLGVLYTIPSLALMILLLPWFGLNARSVIVALILYNQVILVRNIWVGLNEVDPAALEAARGMGMSPAQVLWRVQLPLALPAILAGVRLGAVVTVAIATIGARFGSGGLGVLLFDGVAQNRPDKIFLGALLVSALALVFQVGLQQLERRLRPA
ncbi:MAG: ABC transporter permease [Longilinea sp.]|nr:ABC transporter permease [Longilinea sp.]